MLSEKGKSMTKRVAQPVGRPRVRLSVLQGLQQLPTLTATLLTATLLTATLLTATLLTATLLAPRPADRHPAGPPPC
nr:hypothetical protein GCM10020092_094100 [Actinoplanes digitatis]